tara:strand:- start:32 stop:199 length:168 start_codon:yes stop_codon:yes gene_type:complete
MSDKYTTDAFTGARARKSEARKETGARARKTELRRRGQPEPAPAPVVESPEPSED